MTEEPIIDVEAKVTSLVTYNRNTGMQLAPVKELQIALTEQTERRLVFRTWLKSEFTEGVHHGYPPGCQPQFSDDGKMVKSGSKWHSLKQYAPKQSLYQSGASMVCQLLGLEAEFEADLDSWKMAGEKTGSFYFVCKLYNGERKKVGEGRGCALTDKQWDREANKTLKMAQKRAFVDAVIRVAALQDLFTQDLEDSNPNPSPKKPSDAPNVSSRSERTASDNTMSDLQKLIKGCLDAYKAKNPKATWLNLCNQVEMWTDKNDLQDPKNWDDDLCQIVMIRIDEMQEGGE